MSFISSKWAIGILIVFSALIVLLVIGRKSAHAEIWIKATPDIVWNNLTDISKIKVWNSVLIPIAGELKEGATVTYEFYQEEGGKAAVMSASVQEMSLEKLINQTGGIPLVLTFNHRYQLEPSNQGTKVIIHEEYRGIMVPFWDPGPVEKAYERLLEALKSEFDE